MQNGTHHQQEEAKQRKEAIQTLRELTPQMSLGQLQTLAAFARGLVTGERP